MARKNKNIIFVYVSDEHKEHLQNRAKKEVSTVADIVRKLIEEDRQKNSKKSQ